MTVCVPVRDMKDTAAFTAFVEEKREVTVTKNGYDAMHCISNEQYRIMQEQVAKAHLLSRIMLAERELADESYADYSEFSSAMRRKYDL